MKETFLKNIAFCLVFIIIFAGFPTKAISNIEYYDIYYVDDNWSILNDGTEVFVFEDDEPHIIGIDAFSEIQSAIDKADYNKKYKILVYPGDYSKITIDKWVDLIAKKIQINDTINIIGEETDNTIRITFKSNITGFIVKKGGNLFAGINIATNNVGIINNTIIENDNYGILIHEEFEGLNNINITGNIISNNNNYGIYIENSNENNICNNVIDNNLNYGIYFKNSNNNNLQNNSFWKNKNDIYFYQSSFNTINLTIQKPEDTGIIIKNSNDNFFNNTNITVDGASKMGDKGFEIVNSTSITIINGDFYGCGININGIKKEYWNTHFIEDNYIYKINLEDNVTKYPIYYIKNNSYFGIIPNNASQLILANCQKYKIENVTINDIDTGIQIGFCKDILITNINKVKNNYNGIKIVNSSNVRITDGNQIENNRYGIYLINSDYNFITQENINQNKNNLNSNDYSIFLLNSNFNIIKGNNIIHESSDNVYFDQYGIYIIKSTNNEISYNYIKDNQIGIHLSKDANNNTIYKNEFFYSRQYNAFDEGRNKWDNGEEGNLWHDYENTRFYWIPPYVIETDFFKFSWNRDRFPITTDHRPSRPSLPIVKGPRFLDFYEKGIFSIYSRHIDNIQIAYYEWDWCKWCMADIPDKLTRSIGPFEQGSIVYNTHEFNSAWMGVDASFLSVKAVDINGFSSDWTYPIWIDIGIDENHPPDVPGIKSVHTSIWSQDVAGGDYYFDSTKRISRYNLRFFDIDGDDVLIKVNWGDDSNSELYGPYNITNETIEIQHIWENNGIYNISVIAVDDPNKDGDISDGLSSNWSRPIQTVALDPALYLLAISTVIGIPLVLLTLFLRTILKK